MPHRSLSGRRRSFGCVFSCNKARELDPKRVVRTPNHAALSDIIPSNLKHEFVGNGVSPHTRNFRATVREVAQNAGPFQMTLQVMDCSRQVPLNTKVSSALALHSDVPIGAPVSITNTNSEGPPKKLSAM
jgi:hypothetical protein